MDNAKKIGQIAANSGMGKTHAIEVASQWLAMRSNRGRGGVVVTVTVPRRSRSKRVVDQEELSILCRLIGQSSCVGLLIIDELGN